MNTGIQNAEKIRDFFTGTNEDNMVLQMIPCLNKKIYLASKTEISEKSINLYIRSLLDCDIKLSRYIHNRIVGKGSVSQYIFIGNSLEEHENILGMVMLPH
ncbi:MAG: hypothetical protein N4A45_09905 [Flavobacteriales bacterium]|jgi:ribosomal protein S8|nr:hypothetical protein [Flavobacteriales bacterium]